MSENARLKPLPAPPPLPKENTLPLYQHRASAFILDILFLSLIHYLSITLAKLLFNLSLGEDIELITNAVDLFSLLTSPILFFYYFTIQHYISGQTLGKQLFGIIVVSDNNEPLNLKTSLYRTLGLVLSFWTYGIGFILPLFRKDKKSLHDLLCQTKTIYND